MDEERDDSAEALLIQAFADFVRSSASGERPTIAAPDALLSVAEAAQYLNVSTTTVRNLAVGGKVRSTRIGDRIRFRRLWLDEFIDAGGGEIPAPPPSPPRSPAEPRRSRPTTRTARPRPEPKPKEMTYVQRIADQDLRLLSEAGRGRFTRIQTWHVGVRTSLCGTTGKWSFKVERWPRAVLCPKCLTALAALPEADLARFGVGRVSMMRMTHRGSTSTTIRAGFHTGDGRRTLCGKTDGPWALTERKPHTKPCFVCDHRTRWEARDDDPNLLSPRPLTPLKVLVDVGPVDPRLVELIKRHPRSLDARMATEPLTERLMWSHERLAAIHQQGEPIGHFLSAPAGVRSQRDPWSIYTISDQSDVGLATTEAALQRLPEWADDIERAVALYARWAKEPTRGRRQSPRDS